MFNAKLVLPCYAMLWSSFIFHKFQWLNMWVFKQQWVNINLILITGVGAPFRRGLGGISLLKWAPSGDYFFAAKLYCEWLYSNLFASLCPLKCWCWDLGRNNLISPVKCSDGTFYLWETNTWTSEPWSSKNGFVTVSG